MKLGTRGRYAVIALTDLARQNGDNPVCLSDIADRQGLSLQYLEQLFAKLRRAGLVESVRGKQGGYHLARQPCEIFIADVFQAAQENYRSVRCAGHEAHGCQNKNAKCLTHNLWAGLENHIALYLKSVTLQDVCDQRILPSGKVHSAA